MMAMLLFDNTASFAIYTVGRKLTELLFVEREFRLWSCVVREVLRAEHINIFRHFLGYISKNLWQILYVREFNFSYKCYINVT